MAWSSADVSATDLANKALGYPTVLADHVYRDATINDARWNTAGDFTAADATETDFPLERLRDGYAHGGLHTKPNADQATWYVVVKTTDGIEFDTAFLFFTNLDSLAGSIQIADADGGPWTTIGAFSGDNETRTVLGDLDHTATTPQRYSDVTRLRLNISVSPSTDRPRLRELWLGNRIQLSQNPIEPWPYASEVSQAPRVESTSGVITGNRQARGQARRRCRFQLTDTTQLADFDLWWDQCREGTWPFLWMEGTAIDAAETYLMNMGPDPEYNPALESGTLLRSVGFSLVEQAPYLALEGL